MLLFAALYVCLVPCLQPVLPASSFRTPTETYCSGGNSTPSHQLSTYGKITQSSIDFPLWTSAWCFKMACDQTTLKTWPKNIQQQKSTAFAPNPGLSTRKTWTLKVSSDYLKETGSGHILETPVSTQTFPRSLYGISSDMCKTEPPSNSEEPFLTSACIPCWNPDLLLLHIHAAVGASSFYHCLIGVRRSKQGVAVLLHILNIAFLFHLVLSLFSEYFYIIL